MLFFNKHFWKFVGGFMCILAFAVLTFFGFEYWRNHREEREMKNLIKGTQEKETPAPPPFENPLRSSP